jgi:phosphoribosylformylglycinamidine synthase PurS subunit
MMKARVYVTFKPTVLDPQGQTIQQALRGLGHHSVAAVRQGKYFEIELAPGSVPDQAARERVAKEMDQIAREVLANPIMEDYRVEFLD